jgi:hypothetical protein
MLGKGDSVSLIDGIVDGARDGMLEGAVEMD